MSQFIVRSALIVLIAALSLPTQADPPNKPVRYDNWKVVEVVLKAPAELDRMLSISQLFWVSEPRLGRQLWTVAPHKMKDLADSGLPYQVIYEDFQQLLDREQTWLQDRGGGWYDNYRTYDEINERIDTIASDHPDLATRFYIGDSIQGRPVYGLTITSPVGANKPALLFNGTQHAREWITPMTVTYIAERLATSYETDPQIRALLDRNVFHIVPVVNPDGYVYTWTTDRLWRKNRRHNGGSSYGVDLNRNWATGWGGAGSSGNPSSNTYRGTAPFSEPETANLRDFIDAQTDLVAQIDFHNYSQLILYPFGYDYVVPPEPDLTLFQNLSADLAAVIFDVYGAVYKDKPAHELYLASGIMTDWVYDAAGVLSWTIELRPNPHQFYGFELPADGILLTGAENFEAVNFMALYLAQPLVIRYPDGVPAAVEAGQPTTFPLAVAEASATLDPDSLRLFHRVGQSGAFTETALPPLGANQYQATLPAAACDEQIQFYLQAQTSDGDTVTSPACAPTTPFQTCGIHVIFADDMEIDRGWIVGAADDDATSGIWNRMDPEGTIYRLQQVQPEDDHSPDGTQCRVTDGRAGSNVYDYNVENGKTTLISPRLNLGAYQDPLITYWRWYYNNAVLFNPNDVLQVDISNDDGNSWVNLETLGPEGQQTDGGWYRREFHVADYLMLTGQVRVRFVASDYPRASLVEAAIDDFQVYQIGCPPCIGDLDGDGARDLSDLSILLAHYGVGAGATYWDGDLDGDGDVDLSDLAAILAVYGVPCP